MWPQVNFQTKTIYLEKTKNGSDRHVKLNSIATAVLKDLKTWHDELKLPPDFQLFISKFREPLQNPRRWFTTACKAAQIEGVSWHILRHTFASRLVMAGVHLKTVQELMGHKTLAMTARYAHLAPGHLETELETLVEHRARMDREAAERSREREQPGTKPVQVGPELVSVTKKQLRMEIEVVDK